MTSINATSRRPARHAALAAVISGLAVIVGMGMPAVARANDDDVQRADAVVLAVVDRETGRELPTWRHDGRLFVAGQPGARYGLRVSNHTGGRVLVVLTVDGVNVLTGQTAAYGQRGYIYGPDESYDVDGWRKSTSEVAAFTFAPLPQSYAAETGRPADVGVIGMAVFKERALAPVPVFVPNPAPLAAPRSPPRPDTAPGRTADEARPPASPLSALVVPSPPPLNLAPAARPVVAPAPPPPPPGVAAFARPPADRGVTAQKAEKLGTAHGVREWSVVNIVNFERATPYPWIVRRIEYDTRANLIANGVIPPSTDAERPPRAFPLDADGAGFVPDPPPRP